MKIDLELKLMGQIETGV